jgi:hypothetical protein
MARIRKSTLSFDAITLEGSLLSSAKFAAVAERKAEEQNDADYSIPKGLTLRDETARYFRIGQALFRELHASSTPARHKTIEFTEQLLRGVFGFSDVQVVHSPKFRNDRNFPVTLEALGGRVPVIVVPPSDSLDHASNSLSQDRRRSAASALQDWLNADEAALWGLCTNGESLRLLRDNESLTRPAYLEADLRQIFEAEDYAGFSALWLVLHASRFGRAGALPSDCPLERWRESGSKEGLAARDRLRDGVEAALLALGTGFLTNPANAELSTRLRDGTWPIDEYFRQLLRLVYRLIFLLAAEDRKLLHTPQASEEQRKLYANGYSLGSLRDRAIRRSGWDNFHDRWSGLRVTFRALANGEPRLGLPALGGIFATTATPELDQAHISNRYLMEAIFRLAWLRDDGLLMPVNWRDMETEELGSVYESLLELTPRLSSDGREFKFAERAQTKGNARKTSGSYYTPDSLVQVLLDSALDPVLDRVESESEDPVRGLLGVTVIDPACGSGHFLLAAARRIAKRVVRLRHGDIHTEQQRLAALRDVVRSCIHGVDRNPMAVELTKVALWIETVEPGKPLGFLDANIRLGDSLLGIFSIDALRKGIPDGAYKLLTGDDKTVAKDISRKNKDEIKGQARMALTGTSEPPVLPKLAQSLRSVRQLPEDTAAEVEAKRQRFDSASHDPRLQNLAQAADLYIAAFLTPKTTETAGDGGNSLIPTTADVETALRGGTVYGPRLGAARQLASTVRAFHWPLEFPDIMNAAGFEVVLGNPPWEQIQLDPQEFFADKQPEIAEAQNTAQRSKMISALATQNPKLLKFFLDSLRAMEGYQGFIHDGGRFPLGSFGRLNTAPLFVELSETLSKDSVGLIAPTGIATDSFNQHLFRALVVKRRLATLLDFENRLGLFPDIDSRTKFCVMVLRHSVETIRFAFFLLDPSDAMQEVRNFSLTSDELLAINPNTGTTPIFRSKLDAELIRKIYTLVPVFIDKRTPVHVNPWRVSFMLMFMMNTSSHLFVDGESADVNTQGNSPSPSRYLPVYEGKMIHQFDHRWSTFDGLEGREASTLEKKDAGFEVVTRYWISEEHVASRFSAKSGMPDWFIGWRDITNATNERTVIASAFPFSGVGNNLPLLLFNEKVTAPQIAALLGCMCSLVFDFVARTKVGGTHLNFFIIEQLPVLPPAAYDEQSLNYLGSRVLELTYTSHSMAPFARDLGYDGPPFIWEEDRRALLRAELDAWYARAYGLTRDELRYILDPADVMGPEYPSETFRVLKEKELKLYKEYRTQRLVLDAWDRMERGELHCPVPYDRAKDVPAAPAFALTPPRLRPLQEGLNFDPGDPA